MKKKIILCMPMLLMIMAPFQASCQHFSTTFQEVTTIPEGKSVIYIYRTKASMVHFTVNANDNPVTKAHLYKGGYMVYFADAGKTEIWCEVSKKRYNLIVETEAGKSYFIIGSIGATGISFKLVPPEKALKVIKKCKLLVEPDKIEK